MEVTAEGRLYRERRRSEALDDLSACNRTQELAGVDRVGGHTRGQVGTLGGIDWNYKHLAGRQLRAAYSVEAQHSRDINAVGGGEARRRVTPLDGDHNARHRRH